jgi:hypothetical protein
VGEKGSPLVAMRKKVDQVGSNKVTTYIADGREREGERNKNREKARVRNRKDETEKERVREME